ncbi:MAG: asparaginase domain-containing protein [Candidatus Peregrinibacteria bacterium]|nr:asparaginase domain-containing protein [Candidatus Peregrinibacteria bacterium]
METNDEVWVPSGNSNASGAFDLREYAMEAKNAKSISSYEQLKREKLPEFLQWLSGLRERLRVFKTEGRKVFIVLGTGGTFQSAPGPDGYEPTGRLKESFDALQLPSDKTIHLELCDLMNLDSSQLTVEQWRFLAEAIVQIEDAAGDSYDGIIVTHGTDTMAKGASYISFMLRGFPKSIVFTGSQIPARQPDGDAKDQMRRAIVTSKLAANVNNRVIEVMVACGLKVARATWAAKLGDVTTNAFGPWNQPHQEFDATDWAKAAANGTLDRLAPAFLDFGTGKSDGDHEFASHARDLRKKDAYRPFTNITRPADLYPTRLTDKSLESFADHLIAQRVALLTQLGSATADDALVELALAAGNNGKIVMFEAPFPDSSVEPGRYKAGSAVRKILPFVRRPLPILNTSPDAFEAKVNYVQSELGMQPVANTVGLGDIYSAGDLRKFYDHMETNMVGELV